MRNYAWLRRGSVTVSGGLFREGEPVALRPPSSGPQALMFNPSVVQRAADALPSCWRRRESVDICRMDSGNPEPQWQLHLTHYNYNDIISNVEIPVRPITKIHSRRSKRWSSSLEILCV